MAKATLTLPNGTVVTVEGTTEEVQKLLAYCGGGAEPMASSGKKHRVGASKGAGATRTAAKAGTGAESAAPDLSEIVATIKDCDEAEAIEKQVLDRTSQVNRVLLPLYIVHKYFGNAFGLTSGDVNRITTDLGVRVSTPNASTKLSGTASKYVIADQVRKKGKTLKYKLNRRGVQYMEAVIEGAVGENTA